MQIRKILHSLSLLIVLFLLQKVIPALTSSQEESSNLVLVWNDEFNLDGLADSTKWNYESGFVRNNEIQWYQKENAYCSNGYLVIEGKKESKPNPKFKNGSLNWKEIRDSIYYTSSSLVMKKIHAFKYGRVEVRAKIDAQTGLWPAIWTLGIAGEWPSNGEVDIMEYYDDKILANFAHADKGKWKAIWDSSKTPLDSFGGQKWTDNFHTWALDWDEKSMKIFVDDVLLNDIDLSKTINKSDGKNPFLQPHYLLLNLALGGDKGGSLESTQLPSRYFIDYVRIYQ